jgi:hypothetical protein
MTKPEAKAILQRVGKATIELNELYRALVPPEVMADAAKSKELWDKYFQPFETNLVELREMAQAELE